MNKQDEYTMNSREDIVKKCQEATSGLINLCNDICFNKTSDNILYLAIGKVAKYSDTRALRWTQKIKFGLSFHDQEKITYRNYIKHNFTDLDFIADLIYKEQKKISEADFNMYYTSEEKTIIVVYLVYSSFKKEYEDILFHAGIAIPPYHPTNSDKKFDANWQILQFSSPKKL